MRLWLVGAVAALGTGAGVAQTFDEDMKPKPGKYASSKTLISLDIPGVPANMIGAVRGMVERKSTICLTPEDVEQGYREALRRSQDGECRYNSFTASGGKIEADMVCKTDEGEMRLIMNGTGTPTSSDVTMKMSGDMGGRPGSMTLRVVQDRLGDC